MKTVEEFLASQSNTFHSELLTWFNMQEQEEEIKNDYVLCFQYPFGTYSITLGDLKEKSSNELKTFKDTYVPDND